MTRNKKGRRVLLVGLLALGATSVRADQVISDDLVVTPGSLCTGPGCADGEFFAVDTVRIKGPDPVLDLQDTSSSSSFPTADWRLGITDDGMGGPSHLFVNDAVTGTRMLYLDVDGAVALGAGAEVVNGAVSVGSIGNERPIIHVADAVNDTDAVNLRQFQAFQDSVTASLGADAAAFDQRLNNLQVRIDNLATRVNDLAAQIQGQ
ncbi:MAG TPA: hypothetical protein VKA50_00860 [Gammaproteobacteria bacterium]|nr:hypothetical protein [Gammaproteobacteria bacterium]